MRCDARWNPPRLSGANSSLANQTRTIRAQRQAGAARQADVGGEVCEGITSAVTALTSARWRYQLTLQLLGKCVEAVGEPLAGVIQRDRGLKTACARWIGTQRSR